MISDRNVEANRLGQKQGELTYWTSDGAGALDVLASWTPVSADAFQAKLVAAAAQFPLIEDPEFHEDHKHVTLYVHGYNNTWMDAVQRYQSICESLFSGEDSLGLCILFTLAVAGSSAGLLSGPICCGCGFS